ncbi:hypothetical protein GUITHDRAFT_118140 [Guillardia theta CCMP2712]|uniref:Uncharacterized protein n=1 Tax=Guillardia theta (strain CCMP2712) TaxID=905079 RepID=L1IHD1_GUITC|nr:hypothetical protein GUITHDRAFT_118140 [Guillardia theta CCMP2712]EKX35653.1 hypothetical protein GUITHDRAFT_118140 [Guillardia theta CCMP2712]|eukprot:XP_005822633.1 hypothetical protein GUITHDRAFT_118140 [Guillardia theta CCMP2712]
MRVYIPLLTLPDLDTPRQPAPTMAAVHATMPSDNIFSGIKPDDRVVIENVIAVMKTLSRDLSFSDFEIRSTQNGFVLIAKTCSHVMVGMADLQVIKDCNPVRIQNVAVAWGENNRLAVHVKILNSTAPVTVTETDIIRVKRKRLWGFL